MHFQNALTTRARAMRREPTRSEALLWQGLRGKQLGAKFRRQMPIGPYIVDFGCLSARLIVEVDGHQHGDPDTTDRTRDAWLNGQGFHILRFSNDAVLHKMEGVVTLIASRLGSLKQEAP